VITALIRETLSSPECNTAAVSAEQQRKATRARQQSGRAPGRSPPAPSIPALPAHSREPLWFPQKRTAALPTTPAAALSPRGQHPLVHLAA